mmetsp:Transcript_68764/g.174734  ORF Transcript_68764/g.174734 Transcript_68764/m.174734 type:complete len:284 (-) Transcript_68764:178-1029(-)
MASFSSAQAQSRRSGPGAERAPPARSAQTAAEEPREARGASQGRLPSRLLGATLVHLLRSRTVAPSSMSSAYGPEGSTTRGFRATVAPCLLCSFSFHQRIGSGSSPPSTSASMPRAKAREAAKAAEQLMPQAAPLAEDLSPARCNTSGSMRSSRARRCSPGLPRAALRESRFEGESFTTWNEKRTATGGTSRRDCGRSAAVVKVGGASTNLCTLLVAPTPSSKLMLNLAATRSRSNDSGMPSAWYINECHAGRRHDSSSSSSLSEGTSYSMASAFRATPFLTR